ncbi:MAG TPA: aldolase/citrate lyase family protein [Bryobacteraceae bacterium]|jgi:4-hydroxy-2-oxoheptanedioate aldolase|nr:aldolase/citrate lyase family protein [Bryobacteraceae bacterium]
MNAIWKLTGYLSGTAILLSGVAAIVAQAPPPKPKHINKAIELLEKGQPVYYTGSHSGTEGSFEQGKKDAQTWADYISYDMEHAPFDVKGLQEYMKGLVAGGPTKSGHRTPAVIVNVPVNGTDEASVRANAWMFQQVLATGVHGVLLTHADTPGAIRAFIEACRFPNREQGVGQQSLQEGRRGAHGSPTAAQIWGVSTAEYEAKADAWPLNPNGELLLGVKEEDKYALANVEQNLKIPALSFAEWGPGDMALSLGVKGGAVTDPKMVEARAKVFAAVKANHMFFLNTCSANNVGDMIKEGVMICSANEAAAEAGRKVSKRPTPY